MGWIRLFSLNKEMVYIWFFAATDVQGSKEYERAIFSKIKRLYVNHRIVLSIEAENLNGKHAKQSAEAKQFYKAIGFCETGYFVKREDDSFEIMFIGDVFRIEDFYTIHKEIGWFIGGLMIKYLLLNYHLKRLIFKLETGV